MPRYSERNFGTAVGALPNSKFTQSKYATYEITNADSAYRHNDKATMQNNHRNSAQMEKCRVVRVNSFFIRSVLMLQSPFHEKIAEDIGPYFIPANARDEIPKHITICIEKASGNIFIVF